MAKAIAVLFVEQKTGRVFLTEYCGVWCLPQRRGSSVNSVIDIFERLFLGDEPTQSARKLDEYSHESEMVHLYMVALTRVPPDTERPNRRWVLAGELGKFGSVCPKVLDALEHHRSLSEVA